MDQFKNIPIREITISKSNPRTEFDSKLIEELAESIKVHGILQPIVVRPKGKAYELVSGERRYRASEMIALPDVPCHVKELTDEQAFEVQIIENLQRKDVHPMDEAQAYQKMLDRPGYTIQEVCLKVGKTPEYVHRRIKLNDLLPQFKKMFYEGKLMIGHAIELCRLSEADQTKAEQMMYSYKDVLVSPQELKEDILLNVYMDLKKVPFDKESTTLHPKAGACLSCPKRTGFNKTLFPEIEIGDRCTDSKCFNQKINNHIELWLGEKKKAHEKVAVLWDWSTPTKKDIAKYPLILKRDGDDHKRIEGKEKKCEDSISAIKVMGSDKGKVFKVCNNKNCEIHFSKRKSLPGTKPTQADEEAELLNKLKRNEEIRAEKTMDALWQELGRFDISKGPLPVNLHKSTSFKVLLDLALIDAIGGYKLKPYLDKHKTIKNPKGLSVMELVASNHERLTADDLNAITFAFVKERLSGQRSMHFMTPDIIELAKYMMIPADKILKEINEAHDSRKCNLEMKLKSLKTQPQKSLKHLLNK